MDTSFKQNFFVFILESDLNKVDQRLRFVTDEDLICQLADELYRHYVKEAQKYFHLGNVKMSNDQESLANRIYSELRNVDNNIIHHLFV
jgi:poly-beta-hydroxyalkanoate depolymerase